MQEEITEYSNQKMQNTQEKIIARSNQKMRSNQNMCSSQKCSNPEARKCSNTQEEITECSNQKMCSNPKMQQSRNQKITQRKWFCFVYIYIYIPFLSCKGLVIGPECIPTSSTQTQRYTYRERERVLNLVTYMYNTIRIIKLTLITCMYKNKTREFVWITH